MTTENPLVFIVILTWNGKDDTLECLRSIRTVTYHNFKTLVVDNASHDGTGKAVSDEFPDVDYILNENNLRFSGGNNVGIRHALESGAEYIMLLNNDTIVDNDFLTRLVEVAQEDQDVGMAGPKIYYHRDPKRIWYAGGKIEWWKGAISHIGVREIDKGQYDRTAETDYITGCCVLVKRNVIEKIGMLDDAFYIYGEDADWSVRASRAGYRLMYVHSSMIWHKVSVSTGGHFSWFKNWNKLKSQMRLLGRYAPWYYWFTIPIGMVLSVGSSYLRAKRSK